MKKQPDEIVVCQLNVVLMPNGEIISLGKSLGYFREFKNELTPVSDVTGKPYKEKK